MINYVARALIGRRTMGTFLGVPEARDLRDRVRLVSIERVLIARRLPAGTWIFTDLDRCGPAERALLALVADRLCEAGHRVLNHPRSVLQRHELLTQLHARGLQDFTSHRADTSLHAVRWPVLVRHESDHSHHRPALASSPAEVRAAVADHPLRASIDRHLAVEYVDTRGPDGRWEKRGSFRIGQRIIPEHLTVDDHWFVKYRDLETSDDVARERAFVDGDGDADLLRPVFDLAGIDYGRADYALVDGRLSVFEINTNPVLNFVAGYRDEIWPIRRTAFANVAGALDELVPSRSADAVPAPIMSWSLRREALAETAEYERRFGAPRLAETVRGKLRKELGRYL